MTKATVKTATKAKKPVAKTITVNVITGADKIGAMITSITKRGKSMDKDIHTVAVSTLIHADKHGDITLANKLIAAMPKTARTNALKDWFITFGKFTYDEKNKALAYNGKATTQTVKATNTPFWEFKPEAKYVPFDATTFLQQAIKRVEKAMNDGEKVPTALLTGLQAINTQLTTPDALAA